MIVVLQHLASPTNSNAWKTRRLNKMVRSVFKCCAYVDPTVTLGIGVETFVSSNGGVYHLHILLGEGWTPEQIHKFVTYAKNVDYFHAVILTPTRQPDTITT
jgi:hypothetical protein